MKGLTFFKSENVSFISSRLHLSRLIALVLILIACVLGVLTYLAFNRSIDAGRDSGNVVLLLNLDMGVLLVLVAVVVRRVIKLWIRRKEGSAGSKLHVQLVAMLSALTVAPAIAMALLSAIFLHTGVESWFSTRVQTALDESSAIAQAYLNEHKEVMRANVAAMRRDMAENLPALLKEPQLFDQFINHQAYVRSLSEAIVFDITPSVLARSRLTFALEFEKVTPEDLSKADKDVLILTSHEKDRVRALVRVVPDQDIYLLVGRLVDPQVLERIANTEDALSEYHLLQKNLSDIQIVLTLLFSIIALLLLMLSIWLGLTYASRLAIPISQLLEATEKVREGDLSIRVPIEKSQEDLDNLTKAFNRMTKQLQKQKEELLKTNAESDQRRLFIEALLSSAQAGIIGIDNKRRIEIANKSASELLDINLNTCIRKKLVDVVPEFQEILENLGRDNFIQDELEFIRKGRSHTFMVRIVREKSHTDVKGLVVTFNDVTDLIRAERQAAWTDVARRIAHEIKNPLTPIQLAAERLQRKYFPQITKDRDIFEKCINTISRQVNTIGQMVTEFSSFARMPTPVMTPVDLVSLVHQSITFQQEANTDITIEFQSDHPTCRFKGDHSQIEQVLTNLIQNAADSIHERLEKDSSIPGKITVSLQQVGHKSIVLKVEDNGIGLPKQGREKLTDPYVTFKEKGTGLGLAIVRRIIEDHSGRLYFEDNEPIGARVIVEFQFGS